VDEPLASGRRRKVFQRLHLHGAGPIPGLYLHHHDVGRPDPEDVPRAERRRRARAPIARRVEQRHAAVLVVSPFPFRVHGCSLPPFRYNWLTVVAVSDLKEIPSAPFMISGLESAKLKIARAEEHFDTIKNSIRAYSLGAPYEIITRPDGKEELNIKRPPPHEISILAGEIVYQLRSALDHLAYELVKLNPSNVTLPGAWDENCLFPLWLTPPESGATYNCFKRKLPGISKSAFALVEGLQPYGRGEACKALKLLAQLSNIDKHRHLNVILAKFSQQEQGRRADGTSTMAIKSGVRQGDEIKTLLSTNPGEVAPGRRGFVAYVTFDESTVGTGGERGRQVGHVLAHCVQSIKKDVIPEFDKLLKTP
jgi:hypothetical protein